MAFAIGSVVRRCYIYKDVWSAEIAIDSELPCSPESGNREERYAITHALSVADLDGFLWFLQKPPFEF